MDVSFCCFSADDYETTTFPEHSAHHDAALVEAWRTCQRTGDWAVYSLETLRRFLARVPDHLIGLRASSLVAFQAQELLDGVSTLAQRAVKQLNSRNPNLASYTAEAREAAASLLERVEGLRDKLAPLDGVDVLTGAETREMYRVLGKFSRMEKKVLQVADGARDYLDSLGRDFYLRRDWQRMQKRVDRIEAVRNEHLCAEDSLAIFERPLKPWDLWLE